MAVLRQTSELRAVPDPKSPRELDGTVFVHLSDLLI